MSNALSKRLDALLEKRSKGKDELLIYTSEQPDGHGGLILMSNRRQSGESIEVGRVPASRMKHHRRTVIRIERSYGAGLE